MKDQIRLLWEKYRTETDYEGWIRNEAFNNMFCKEEQTSAWHQSRSPSQICIRTEQ